MRPAEQAILDARPALDEMALELVGFVRLALHQLDRDRPIGMDVGKIPWTAIDQWMRHPDRADLDVVARTIVTDAICYVDDLEFADRMKKRKSASPGPGKPPRGPIARAAQGASR